MSNFWPIFQNYKQTIKYMEKLVKSMKKQLALQNGANNARKGKIKQLKKDVKKQHKVQEEFRERLEKLEMQFSDLEKLLQNYTEDSVSTDSIKYTVQDITYVSTDHIFDRL